MKIQDVPQVGKLGLTVTWPGRNGLIRRTKVIPRNPRSVDQEIIRSHLASQAAAYGLLSDAQQAAWRAAAAQIQTRATLGQSGPMTGNQLFVKVNCALLAIGAPTLTTPPALPLIEPLPVNALEITNTGGVIALKLATAGTPPEGTMLWGSPPAGGGVTRPVSPRLLGTLDSPVANQVDITSQYTAKYGTPAVGKRIVVQVNANINGFEGPRLTFAARVPAAS